MRRAAERRGNGGNGDASAHTRRSDHLNTPHGLEVWSTTFNLRWAEHLKHARHDGGHRAA